MVLQLKLEVTQHITPHANGEPLLSRAPHVRFFPSSAMILFVVWSANGDAPFQGKFQSQFTK